ncbi:MAG: response regulator transcription factor [Defluviitaleaceae bacterium]|nr:response regulator transcription factor [Defluviitaleaceae bacterium]MCL2274504.1 response regulator transcription factor [Defluviitaleaceae bacterium]
MPPLIYIAEDEKNIRYLVRSYLEKEGYRVQAFENGDQLYEAFKAAPCDLVVLDIMMPGSSGFIVCTKIRAISPVPIIMLTARDTDEDYISGISLGSDDYFTKPFSPVKLIMRVKAMLRRVAMDTAEKTDTRIHFADITLYPEKYAAFCGETQLNLTNTEFSLLAYLLANQDRAISREELLNKIWGYDNAVETRATDATVKRLRKKLADLQSTTVIETIWGHGFRLTERKAQ